MSAAEKLISVPRPSPATVALEREKASFDSEMVMIRFQVKHAEHDAAEYFFRQLMEQCKVLSRRYGFRVA